MIARQIGIVLCRVGAAFLMVQAIRALGFSLPGLLFGFNDASLQVVVLLVLSVIPMLAALGLWLFADRISAVIEPIETPAEGMLLAGVDLVRIGTALIGIYLAASAVSYGLSVEASNLVTPEFGDIEQSFTDAHAAAIVGHRTSYISQLIIGLALLVGRHRIAAMLARAKYAGVDR